MPIYPLPQFEADVQALEEEDRKIYERLKAPSTVVVRFGSTFMVGEFLYDLGVTPGCGTKLVVRTNRGLELGDMLTSTCPNAGCDKSVSRKEMLEYIDNSGGRDYPFYQQGKVERIATAQDMLEQERINSIKPELARAANMIAKRLGLDMKVVEAEPILGGEKLTFYFTSEQRIDFREMVSILASEHRTRIEMRQVGARDEARLTADYERCGQHCCCKQFLKVLKPISMRSAKVQKATLDPLKISGRCGRLMCCLRYEDETYEDLRARLPKKKQRVKSEDGWGIVIDTQILTQLALVQMEPARPGAEIVEIAVPIEELEWEGKVGPSRTRAERPASVRVPGEKPAPAAARAPIVEPETDHGPPVGGNKPGANPGTPPAQRGGGNRRGAGERRGTERRARGGPGDGPANAGTGSTQGGRSRGGRPGQGGGGPGTAGGPAINNAGDSAPTNENDGPGTEESGGSSGSGEGAAKRRRRRRRRGGGSGGGGEGGRGGEGSGGGGAPGA